MRHKIWSDQNSDVTAFQKSFSSFWSLQHYSIELHRLEWGYLLLWNSLVMIINHDQLKQLNAIKKARNRHMTKFFHVLIKSSRLNRRWIFLVWNRKSVSNFLLKSSNITDNPTWYWIFIYTLLINVLCKCIQNRITKSQNQHIFTTK